MAYEVEMGDMCPCGHNFGEHTEWLDGPCDGYGCNCPRFGAGKQAHVYANVQKRATDKIKSILNDEFGDRYDLDYTDPTAARIVRELLSASLLAWDDDE